MVGNYFTTKQLRAFRIPVDQEDGIKLSLLQGEQVLVDAENIDVKDISLTGLGFVSSREFQLGHKIDLNLEFSDYLNVIEGFVVRCHKVGDKFIVGMVFNFDEGESFESFFQKFIKRFSAKRMKDELLNLIQEQNYSSTHASELLILNEIQSELTAYGNSPVYFETLTLQMKEKLCVDSLDMFILDSETGKYRLLSDNFEESTSYDISGSVIERALEHRCTLNALIMSDNLLADNGFLGNLKNKFVLCEPVTDAGGKIKGFAIASRSKHKYKYVDEEVSLMKLFAHEAGRYIGLLENQMNLEPIKFLNPKKPREFAMIGTSDAVLNLRKFISQTKIDMEPVCIKGAQGSGRTLLAKIVHSEGKMGHTDFLDLDGGVQAHLSILDYLVSGHRLPLDYKNTGTIYISNFNEMNLTNQIKLLNFSKENKGLFRVIVSLEEGQELAEDVSKFFKNNKIRVPSLNERKDDIPTLVNYLIRKECKKRGYLSKTISRNVLDKFKNHDWNGNIRELKTAVSRLVSWFSSNHYIDSFPPESYQIFSENKNSEFDPLLTINQVRKVAHLFTEDEMKTLIHWGVISIEMRKHENNLKKAALALGKPHDEIVSLFEAGEMLFQSGRMKKAA